MLHIIYYMIYYSIHYLLHIIYYTGMSWRANELNIRAKNHDIILGHTGTGMPRRVKELNICAQRLHN